MAGGPSHSGEGLDVDRALEVHEEWLHLFGRFGEHESRQSEFFRPATSRCEPFEGIGERQEGYILGIDTPRFSSDDQSIDRETRSMGQRRPNIEIVVGRPHDVIAEKLDSVERARIASHADSKAIANRFYIEIGYCEHLTTGSQERASAVSKWMSVALKVARVVRIFEFFF